MVAMEEKSIKYIVEDIEGKIEKQFLISFLLDGKKCFIASKNHFFMITGLEWDKGAIVVEHARSEEDAKNNIFEDGDVYYVDEMSEKRIYEAVIREISD